MDSLFSVHPQLTRGHRRGELPDSRSPFFLRSHFSLRSDLSRRKNLPYKTPCSLPSFTLALPYLASGPSRSVVAMHRVRVGPCSRRPPVAQPSSLQFATLSTRPQAQGDSAPRLRSLCRRILLGRDTPRFSPALEGTLSSVLHERETIRITKRVEAQLMDLLGDDTAAQSAVCRRQDDRSVHRQATR